MGYIRKFRKAEVKSLIYQIDFSTNFNVMKLKVEQVFLF